MLELGAPKRLSLAPVVGHLHRASTEPVLVVLVVLIAYFSIVNETFRSSDNWTDLATSYFPELAILTMSATLVLLIGGIDLSVAAVSALSAVVAGEMFQAGHGVLVTLVVSLAVAALAGTLNGVLVVYARVSPIVTTLGTLQLYRGLALGITDGQNVSGFPDSFTSIGQDFVGRVPAQMFLVVAIAGVMMLALHRSTTGRWVYALGGNTRAARFSGVPTARLTIGVYAVASLIAGSAGLVGAARLASTRSDLNAGMELDAITAAILGGISIAGGRGKVLFALIGALSIAVLRNGLTLLNLSGYVQVVAVGLLLIIAVLLQAILRRRTLRQETRAQLRPRSSRSSDRDPKSSSTDSRPRPRGKGDAPAALQRSGENHEEQTAPSPR